MQKVFDSQRMKINPSKKVNFIQENDYVRSLLTIIKLQNIEISKISNSYEKLTFQIEELKNKNLNKKGFFNYFQESDVDNIKGKRD